MILSVVLATLVSFLVAAVILRASRKKDVDEDALSSAIAKTESNKGKKSDALSGLAASGAAGAPAATAAGVATADAPAGSAPATETHPIHKVVFACDAGMGSSAMGASVMRNKIKKAGIDGVSVTNVAIANLDDTPDLIITQKELTERARAKTPGAVHVSVDNFMNSPRYDEVVDLLRRQQENGTE